MRSRRKDVGWSLLSELLRVASAAVLFLVLARVLGVRAFGLFSALTALVLTVAPFANLGAGHVMIRAISHGEEPGVAFARALRRIVVGGTAGVVVLVLSHPFYMSQVPWVPLVLIAIAELFGTAVNDLVTQKAFAQGRAFEAARHRAGIACARLGAAGVLGALGSARGDALTVWACLYLAATAVITIRSLHGGRAAGSNGQRLSTREYLQGLPFSLNISAAYLQDDFDKTLVLRGTDLLDAGNYAAGYRVLSFAYLPLQAALNVVYPRYFRAYATDGTAGALRLTRLLLLPAAAYGLLAAAALTVAAWLAPHVLGHEYDGTSPVVLAVCWLPLNRAFAYLAADYCTATGRQWLRVAIQVAGATLNIALNLVFIPTHGWMGAVYASAVSEPTTLVLLVAAGVCLTRAEQRRAPRAPIAPAVRASSDGRASG